MTPVQYLLSSLSLIEHADAKKEKEAILVRLRSLPEARRFFERATDPFNNYWITVDIDALGLAHTGENNEEAITARFQEFDALCTSLATRAVTGAAAATAVHTFLASCGNIAPYFEAKWYSRALNQHLNIGVASKAISVAWPDLVSDFGVPLAEPLYVQTTGQRNEDVFLFLDAHFPLTQEPKLDGANGSVIAAGAKATVSSRAEGAWPACMSWQRVFAAAMQQLSKKYNKDLTHWVINGEFKAKLQDDDPKTWTSSWGKTVAMVRAGLSPTGYDPAKISEHLVKCFKRGDLEYIVYDTYPYSAYKTGEWSTSYGHKTIPGTRSAMCAQIVAAMRAIAPALPVRHVEQHIVHNWDEVKALHDRFLAEGHEGSMLKTHLPCTLDRTKKIVKYKEYEYFDAVVLCVNQGTNSNKDKGGTYTAWYPDKDDICDVTIRTNALKQWSWDNRFSIPGFRIETAEQKDKTAVAKARNPTLVRPRVDSRPLPIEEVAKLCERFGVQVPQAQQMAPAMFAHAIASFKL